MTNEDEPLRSESPEHPRFSNFETIELLGQGGMGTVWMARQKNLPRVVALKVLNAGKLARASELKRFKTEASAAAKLQHPSLIPIYEVGEEQGCCYFTMEYVEGQTLAQLLRGTPLEPRRAAELLLTMAEAIEYAHGRGVLHRDLKPGNVIVDYSGRPRITDFGLAKELYVESSVTESNAILGTPSYMSPEQAEGKTTEISPKSDVYSLGAVLYEMITGRPPFRAHNLSETLRQVIAGAPALPRSVNPKVQRDLETICMKCLQKESGRRYGSAQELANDLGRFLKNEPIRARPVGMSGRAWRVLRRNPVVATSLGATAVLLVTMAAGGGLARQNLLTANGLLAETTAAMLELQLEGLARIVNEVAEDPEIIEATQAGDKTKLNDLLGAKHRSVNASPNHKWLGGEPFQNWNIYNMAGEPLVRISPRNDGQPRMERFNDRDYFIGATQRWTNPKSERIYLSKVHFSRWDTNYKFGFSVAIAPKDRSGAEPAGLLIAMVTTRSSAPLSDIEQKIALIGRADPSDKSETLTNFVFKTNLFVLHPAYSFQSPAVGVNELPFNPKKRIHDFYADPVAGRFPAYQGLWLAGSAPIKFPGSEDHFYVVVQSRDWIFTFVVGTFAVAVLAFLAALAKRNYTQWKARLRAEPRESVT